MPRFPEGGESRSGVLKSNALGERLKQLPGATHEQGRPIGCDDRPRGYEPGFLVATDGGSVVGARIGLNDRDTRARKEALKKRADHAASEPLTKVGWLG